MKEISPTHSFNIEETTNNIYHANMNEGIPRHEHVYAHVTYCSSGSIIVRKEGKELVMDKNTKPILLKANEWHEIESMEDNTVFCNVFSIDKY